MKPYQPAGYYAHLNFPPRKYRQDAGGNLFRRSVYMHWQRQFLHPMLKAFDAPSREECTARRPTSNTPLASLVLLNDPQFVEAACKFAERIVREGGDSTESRIDWAWREALSRGPSAEERKLVREFHQVQIDIYRQDNKAAAALLGVGVSPRSGEMNVAELAAWTAVARAIFNLNELITRN